MRTRGPVWALVFLLCASAARGESRHLCSVKDNNDVVWDFWRDEETAFFHDAVEDRSVFPPPDGVGEFAGGNDWLICRIPVVGKVLGIDVYLSYTEEYSHAYFLPVEGEEHLDEYQYTDYSSALHGLCEESEIPFCSSTQYDNISTKDEVMKWIESQQRSAGGKMFMAKWKESIKSAEAIEKSKRKLEVRDDMALIKPTVRNDRKSHYETSDLDRLKFNYEEKAPSKFPEGFIEALLSDHSKGFPGDLASIDVGGYIVPGANLGALARGCGTLSFFFLGKCDKDGSSKMYGVSNSHVLNEDDDAVDMLMRQGSPVYAPSLVLAPVAWARQKGQHDFERLREIIAEYLKQKEFPLFKDVAKPSIHDLPEFVRNWLTVNTSIIEHLLITNNEAAEILQKFRNGWSEVWKTLRNRTYASGGYRVGTHIGSFSAGKEFEFRRVDAKTGSDVDIGVFEFDDALDRVPSNVVSLDGDWTTIGGKLSVGDLEEMAESGELGKTDFYFVGSRSGRTTCKILDKSFVEEKKEQFQHFATFPYLGPNKRKKKGGPMEFYSEYVVDVEPSESSNVLFSGIGGKDQIICYMDQEFGVNGEPWPRMFRDMFAEAATKGIKPDFYRAARGLMKEYIDYMLHSWKSPGRKGDSGGILYSGDGKIVGVGHAVSWGVQGFMDWDGGNYMNMLAVSPIDSVLSSVRTVLAETSQSCKNKDDWTVSMELDDQ